MTTPAISLPSHHGAPGDAADDPRAVTILAFEQWLNEAPLMRCLVPPHDAPKLRPGMRVHVDLTLGRVDRLDGGNFVIEVVRPDGFAIPFPLADPRALFGVQGRAAFDPDAPIVQRTGPPITDFKQVWVFKYGVALANNLTGFVLVPRADADAMIAAGDAVDAYDSNGLPEIGSAGPRPPPQQPVPRTDQPEPLVILISGMSEGLNPICHSEDLAGLRSNDLIKLQQIAGPALFPQINGKTGIVLRSSSRNFFQLFGVSTRGLAMDTVACRGEVVTARRVHIEALTAANPTQATSRDAALAFEGDEIFLDQLTGTNLPALDLQLGRVRNLTATGFDIEGVDLTGATVTDVTAMGSLGRPDIINFIVFTADTATVATVPGRQGLGLMVGDEMTIHQYAGDPIAALDGTPAVIADIAAGGYEMTLTGIDLSGQNVFGVRAYGLITRRPGGRPPLAA